MGYKSGDNLGAEYIRGRGLQYGDLKVRPESMRLGVGLCITLERFFLTDVLMKMFFESVKVVC